jgi:altronate hydrolase
MNWQATTLAAGDNVATVLQPIAAGETVAVWTAAGVIAITALEPVALCHKIALADLAAGTAVIKYGQCIGRPRRRSGRAAGCMCTTCAAARAGGGRARPREDVSA